jgi:hypothetical protein
LSGDLGSSRARPSGDRLIKNTAKNIFTLVIDPTPLEYNAEISGG